MRRLALISVLASVVVGFTVRSAVAAPELPVSGWPVANLQVFDDAMQDYMNAWGIDGGVLAVATPDGTIVYQRGFGRLHPASENALPENTPMRVASVEKPITAAAMRILDNQGGVDPGDLVFDLDRDGAGILPHIPWEGIGEGAYRLITIAHLMGHRGGWSTAASGFPPQFRSIEIADAMDVPHPAGRDNTVRFMLHRDLDYTPGDNGCTDNNGNPTFCYSNFGYMLLGLIVEEVTGRSHVDYIHRNVLTPNMWVPAQEIFRGRSFDGNQSSREPTYRCDCQCANVFDPDGDEVSCPYGGWNHESFVGHGNLVASAATLLVFMENYRVAVGGPSGMPLSGGHGGGRHTGAVDGTSTLMWQRGSDGFNIVVLFSERDPNGGQDYALGMGQVISDLIDAGGITWPTTAVDGTWVNFNATDSRQFGGYNTEFHSVGTAFARVGDGTKLRFKPGSSSWTGTISKKLRIDAPLGLVRIGAR